MAKHRLTEVLNDLCAALCFHQPTNAKSFLIDELTRRKTEGTEAGVFEQRELDAVFSLADLMGSGLISDVQCKQALLSLASSKKQYDAIEASTPPKEVDRKTFVGLAKGFLGLPDQ